MRPFLKAEPLSALTWRFPPNATSMSDRVPSRQQAPNTFLLVGPKPTAPRGQKIAIAWRTERADQRGLPSRLLGDLERGDRRRPEQRLNVERLLRGGVGLAMNSATSRVISNMPTRCRDGGGTPRPTAKQRPAAARRPRVRRLRPLNPGAGDRQVLAAAIIGWCDARVTPNQSGGVTTAGNKALHTRTVRHPEHPPIAVSAISTSQALSPLSLSLSLKARLPQTTVFEGSRTALRYAQVGIVKCRTRP